MPLFDSPYITPISGLDCPRARPGVGQKSMRLAASPPAALQLMTDDDDNRHQQAEQYWPIRQASNKTPETYFKT